MNFIEAPLTVGIIFYFIYMVFELFARKDERIRLIEKLGQNSSPVDATLLKSQFSTLLPSFSKKSFTALRAGSLLVGLGLGLMAGLFLFLSIKSSNIDLERWERDTFYSLSISASVLLFGGLGLVISYIIESKTVKKDEK